MKKLIAKIVYMGGIFGPMGSCPYCGWSGHAPWGRCENCGCEIETR